MVPCRGWQGAAASATPSATPVPLVDAAMLLDDVPGKHKTPEDEEAAIGGPGAPCEEEEACAADVDDIDAVDITSTSVTSAEVRPDEEDDSSVTMSLCTWPGTESCGTGGLAAAASLGHFVALCRPPQQPQAMPNRWHAVSGQ